MIVCFMIKLFVNKTKKALIFNFSPIREAILIHILTMININIIKPVIFSTEIKLSNQLPPVMIIK
jgi:hypothetical protein